MPYGATLNVKADQQIKAGTVLANWDPLTRPIITEFAGKAKFENVEEGVTVAKQVDEVTGLSTLVVIDRSAVARPRSCVRRSGCSTTQGGHGVKIPGTDHSVAIGFQVGALIQIRDGRDLFPVKCSPASRSKARRPVTSPAVCRVWLSCSKPVRPRMSASWPTTGTVSVRQGNQGQVRCGLITDPDGKAHEELVPKEKNILVHEGRVVNRAI